MARARDRLPIKIVVFSMLTFIIVSIINCLSPSIGRGENLIYVSATPSNSRFSFIGKTDGNYNAGETLITIQQNDNADNTHNLFTFDDISISGQQTTITEIIDDATFKISPALTASVTDAATVYNVQKGGLTIYVTPKNSIPPQGLIKVIIPDPPANGNDTYPDTTDSIYTNGFDLNGMTEADFTVSGGSGCVWDGAKNLTAGAGSGHTFTQITSSGCTGGEISIVIDDSPGLINPAPVPTKSDTGTADVYTLLVQTYDGNGEIIDEVRTKLAPVGAIEVEATVPETISFTVSGVSKGSNVCGKKTDASTLPSFITFGNITVPTNGIKIASQLLTVTTNSENGYVVQFYEDEELKRSDAAESIIADTSCDALCTHQAFSEWKDTSVYGFGYSLANSSGADAQFTYNQNNNTFASKRVPNYKKSQTQYNDTDAEVMSSNKPTDNSSVFVCYGLSLAASQPSGFYSNNITYIATPIF